MCPPSSTQSTMRSLMPGCHRKVRLSKKTTSGPASIALRIAATWSSPPPVSIATRSTPSSSLKASSASAEGSPSGGGSSYRYRTLAPSMSTTRTGAPALTSGSTVLVATTSATPSPTAVTSPSSSTTTTLSSELCQVTASGAPPANGTAAVARVVPPSAIRLLTPTVMPRTGLRAVTVTLAVSRSPSSPLTVRLTTYSPGSVNVRVTSLSV